MTFSIAWVLYAPGLTIAGIRKQLRPVRFAAIGLIGVTLIKLFSSIRAGAPSTIAAQQARGAAVKTIKREIDVFFPIRT